MLGAGVGVWCGVSYKVAAFFIPRLLACVGHRWVWILL